MGFLNGYMIEDMAIGEVYQEDYIYKVRRRETPAIK